MSWLGSAILCSFEQMEAIPSPAPRQRALQRCLGGYPLLLFESCINEQDLDEMNIEIIRKHSVQVILGILYNLCHIGGETADVMCEILGLKLTGELSSNHYSLVLN